MPERCEVCGGPEAHVYEDAALCPLHAEQAGWTPTEQTSTLGE